MFPDSVFMVQLLVPGSPVYRSQRTDQLINSFCNAGIHTIGRKPAMSSLLPPTSTAPLVILQLEGPIVVKTDALFSILSCSVSVTRHAF